MEQSPSLFIKKNWEGFVLLGQEISNYKFDEISKIFNNPVIYINSVENVFDYLLDMLFIIYLN